MLKKANKKQLIKFKSKCMCKGKITHIHIMFCCRKGRTQFIEAESWMVFTTGWASRQQREKRVGKLQSGESRKFWLAFIAQWGNYTEQKRTTHFKAAGRKDYENSYLKLYKKWLCWTLFKHYTKFAYIEVSHVDPFICMIFLFRAVKINLTSKIYQQIEIIFSWTAYNMLIGWNWNKRIPCFLKWTLNHTKYIFLKSVDSHWQSLTLIINIY